MRRVIGMDIHRTFAEVVIWEQGRRRRPTRRRTSRSGRRDDADQLCRAHSSETKRRVELIAKVSLPERQNSEHVGFAFVVTERREHSIGNCN